MHCAVLGVHSPRDETVHVVVHIGGRAFPLLLSQPPPPVFTVVLVVPANCWQGDDPLALKHEFMHKFHNISRIMDCVGCEKCKVRSWSVFHCCCSRSCCGMYFLLALPLLRFLEDVGLSCAARSLLTVRLSCQPRCSRAVRVLVPMLPHVVLCAFCAPCGAA